MQGMPPMPPNMQGMQLTPMFFPSQMATFDGKRMRRSVQRKTVDYNAPVFQYIEDRLYKKSLHGSQVLQPHKAYYIDVSDSYCTSLRVDSLKRITCSHFTCCYLQNYTD